MCLYVQVKPKMLTLEMRKIIRGIIHDTFELWWGIEAVVGDGLLIS